MSAVERQRRYRARWKAGTKLVPFELKEAYQMFLVDVACLRGDLELDREKGADALHLLLAKCMNQGVSRTRAFLAGLPVPPNSEGEE